MHAGAVRVDNEKMSKSLGNFFTIREILEKYHPEVIRYFLLSSHYRSPINYSEENLKAAQIALERFYTALRDLPSIEPLELSHFDQSNIFVKRFIDAMDDDFSTPEALSTLFDIARFLNTARSEDRKKEITELQTLLVSLGNILGILQLSPESFLQDGRESSLTKNEIELLIEERNQAKLNKDYQRADEIRNQLKSLGIILEDSRQGTSWRRELSD
jgi:cysteinyl-tRNA synthetase